MALEDYFNLSEMNSGFMDPARVRELVSIMQKERDSAVKNFDDAIRQWSAVAKTIAATENKDCLDLFIQLDGHSIIDSWLRDTQKYDASDSSREESITDLLRALKKLHSGTENLVPACIWMTVNNLLGHSSSQVQDWARALLDSWKNDKDSLTVPQVTGVDEVFHDGLGDKRGILLGVTGPSESSLFSVPLALNSSCKEKHEHSARDDLVATVNADDVPASEMFTDVQISSEALDPVATDDGSVDHVVYPSVSKPSNEFPCANVEPVHHYPKDTVSVETQYTGLGNGSVDGLKDVSMVERSSSPAQMHKIKGSFEKLDKGEESKPLKDGVLSLNDGSEEAIGSMSIHGAQRSFSSEDNSSSSSASTDVKRFPTNDHNFEGSKDLRTFLSRLQCVEGDDKAGNDSSDPCENDLKNDYDVNKLGSVVKSHHLVSRKSNLELDYGIVDPLEVARQVAIEVEREVQSSSSEELQQEESKDVVLDSTDSTSEQQCQSGEGSHKEVSSGKDLSSDTSPIGEVNTIKDRAVDAELKIDREEVESSQVTEAAQDPKPNKKERCNFDLNQDVCSEDMDHMENPILTSASVVSSSRAVPGVVDTHLPFEGALGWKVSAATSTFHLESPCNGPDSGKGPAIWGSKSSSKQICLDIDLNVAETGDDEIARQMPQKQVSFVMPSGESSVDTSARRLVKLELDLNRASDVSEAPLNWQMKESPFHGYFHQDQIPFSSTEKQAFLRSINLNDQPFLGDSSNSPHFSRSSKLAKKSGLDISGESVISIMGKRVEVIPKELSAETLPLVNGRTPEPASGVYFTRTGAVSGQDSSVSFDPSVYGYNAIMPGPTLPFSSGAYGHGFHVPCMANSKGAAVMPQITGSASSVARGFSQSPFLLSLTSTPSSNGSAPSQDGFDLSSGLMLGTGNKEPVGLRQFFNLGQTWRMGEHTKSNHQPSTSSGVGVKRKEPHNGLEPYHLQQHMPPWK